jgi:hypothetical protein
LDYRSLDFELRACHGGECVSGVSADSGEFHAAVHRECCVHVDFDVRHDQLYGTLQGSAVPKHNLRRQSDSNERQWKRNGKPDDCFSYRDDAGIGNNGAGSNAAIHRFDTGNVERQVRNDHRRRPVHGNRGAGNILHH